MSAKYIATKLHIALALAPEEPVLSAATALPHYVIDRRLTEMLGREDVQKSIVAMIEAEVARLPFPAMLVEFDAEHGVRRFTVLRETVGGFEADLCAMAGGVLTIGTHPAQISLTKTGLAIKGHASELDGLAAGFSAAISLLMLNVQGIDKDVIEPRHLNKARRLAGKPSVPTHTVVRIGTITDRTGKRIPANQARTMPIHLRAGHARHQHYGIGWSETKVIYIPPVLVNFKDGDDAKAVRQPKKVLTR